MLLLICINLADEGHVPSPLMRTAIPLQFLEKRIYIILSELYYPEF